MGGAEVVASFDRVMTGRATRNCLAGAEVNLKGALYIRRGRARALSSQSDTLNEGAVPIGRSLNSVSFCPNKA
jgi:hypothetical protein